MQQRAFNPVSVPRLDCHLPPPLPPAFYLVHSLAQEIAFEGSDLQAAVCRDWYFFAGRLAAVNTYCVKTQMILHACSFQFCQGNKVLSVPTGRSRFMLVSSHFEGQNYADLRRGAWVRPSCKRPFGEGKRVRLSLLGRVLRLFVWEPPHAMEELFFHHAFLCSLHSWLFSCIMLSCHQKLYRFRPLCCAAALLL